ncbi:hypothetical protein FRX31_034515 [Thalictrum thalictroides]|uniref:Uncharacterized protein n=1 Tax=Thalictrum thalictroides TaxID=46969 RepID=A0A7J6UTX2_THATH|nr:hypothetical protein FRX31_034515 [Thalictrum thalictroides]
MVVLARNVMISSNMLRNTPSNCMGKKQGLRSLIVETDFKGAVDYIEGKATNLSWMATNDLLDQVTLRIWT